MDPVLFAREVDDWVRSYWQYFHLENRTLFVALDGLVGPMRERGTIPMDADPKVIAAVVIWIATKFEEGDRLLVEDFTVFLCDPKVDLAYFEKKEWDILKYRVDFRIGGKNSYDMDILRIWPDTPDRPTFVMACGGHGVSVPDIETILQEGSASDHIVAARITAAIARMRKTGIAWIKWADDVMWWEETNNSVRGTQPIYGTPPIVSSKYNEAKRRRVSSLLCDEKL